MRKAPKILISLFSIYLLHGQSSAVNLCASTQTYSALEAVREHCPEEFNVHYAFAEELEALISDPKSRCQIIISSGEKIPVLLTRSGKALISDMRQIARAPLILWSADPSLLDYKASAVSNKKLKSLAIPKSELTPVGYASAQIVSKPNFPTNYLKGHIYRAEHEYQVLAMVNDGNVQAGFITKPLIMDAHGHTKGSYWQTPRNNYPELGYYLIPLLTEKNKENVKKLCNYLMTSPEVLSDFIAAGFDKPLNK